MSLDDVVAHPLRFAAFLGLSLFGAVISYVFAKGDQPASSEKFWRKFFQNKSDIFYFRFDFFFTSISGMVAAQLLYSPQTFYAAFAAGVTWAAGIDVVTRRKS